jgi:Transposase
VGAKPRSYQVTPAGPSQPDVDKTVERQPRTGDRHRRSQTSSCFGSNHRSSGNTTLTLSPTEAINGRLEHLRGSALGFRNLTNYIARSLLETGGFRPRLHPALVKSRSSWGSAKDTMETGNQ